MADKLIPPAADVVDVLPQSMAFMNNTMETFLSAASVDAVFAKPVKAGDTVIIPAAEVLSGMGFGMGGGGGTGPVGADADDEEQEEKADQTTMAGGSGVGGGGGGRILSRPVAIVIASPEGVRVEPVVDVTKIGLAMFTALGFMVGMLARMRRPGRDA
ncbi:MAG: hypothetical protein ACOYYS_03205 [Chloroflexota bacterium]